MTDPTAAALAALGLNLDDLDPAAVEIVRRHVEARDFGAVLRAEYERGSWTEQAPAVTPVDPLDTGPPAMPGPSPDLGKTPSPVKPATDMNALIRRGRGSWLNDHEE